MDIGTFAVALESSLVGEWMRNSVKAMPIVEATHVLAVAVLFGTILIVDLRLIGRVDTHRPYLRMHDELVRWTWGAFGIAVVTGVLMFLPNATTYFSNTPFLYKMVALACAGANMAVFERITARDAAAWDNGQPVPFEARMAGVLSIVFWVGVIFFGRWIGFTKGYNFEIPEGIELDFDFSDVGSLYLRSGAGVLS